MQNKIYLITGLMASGKSTVAELLAKEFPKSVHLRGDVFRRMIVNGREEMSEKASEEAVDQLEMRYDLTVQVAKTYFGKGFTVIIQDNYYGKYLTKMASAFSEYPLHITVLNPSIAIIEERERNRNKTGYTGFSVAPLYNTFQKETPKLGCWIDTSNMTADETVKIILQKES